MSGIISNVGIKPCLSMIMPVYNEAATAWEIIRMVMAQPPVQQLVIVDDGSTDGTREKLQPLEQAEPRIKLVRHAMNQGKGAAVRSGISLAIVPIVII